jgi:hypothetical protein
LTALSWFGLPDAGIRALNLDAQKRLILSENVVFGAGSKA